LLSRDRGAVFSEAAWCAPSANEAIKIAAKEFDIPPELQNRIAVEKVSKSED
jgi:hypothetical protein